MGYAVDKDVLSDFGFYLGAEAGQTLPRLEDLARREGMSDHGFTGLLEPLGNVVNGEASVLVGSAFSLMQRKLCDLGDSVVDVAKQYGWTDHSNASLFDRNKLGGDTDKDVTYGSGYGEDGYDNYTDGGYSKFHYTPLEISPIDRPDTRYSDEIDEHGPLLDVLDWIWREFDVDHGRGFTDSLISPLAGNHNSIKANGEAWQSVGKNLGLLASNLGDNATTLATQFWQGPAATAFEQFLDLYWHKGAVWAGQQLGAFVATGFDKIADASQRIATVAIEAINAIIRAVGKIAAKAIPVIGWAWTVIESAAKVIGDLFGIDVDNLYNDIMNVVNNARAIVKLFDNMEKAVETMKGYFATLEELVNTVKQIPEIDSVDHPGEDRRAYGRAGQAEDRARQASRQGRRRAGRAGGCGGRSGGQVVDSRTPEMAHAERELDARIDYALGAANEVEAAADELERKASEPLSDKDVERIEKYVTTHARTPEWQQVIERIDSGRLSWREVVEGLAHGTADHQLTAAFASLPTVAPASVAELTAMFPTDPRDGGEARGGAADSAGTRARRPPTDDDQWFADPLRRHRRKR